MDTALHPAVARRPDAAPHASGPSPVPAVRTVSVVAIYRLSEAGRKASLLAGGNGRQRQQVVLDVPVTRMHLVHVDPNGTARLKLRPRFELRAQSQRVVRVEEVPQYDAPPSTEALLQDAARNHQLEATYQAPGVSHRSTRLDASRTWRDEVAVSFLSDATRRAITHPSPTPRRCVVATERGRMDFDAKRDRGAARDVPLEAYRRLQADLRARRERAQDDVATFHAAHAEKWRLVREWVKEHGICGKKRSSGLFTVRRHTNRKRMQTKLQAVKTELRHRMHRPLREQGAWLRSVVGGHIRYYGVPTNAPALYMFRFQVGRLWFRTLRQRSQRHHLTWERMRRHIDRWLPPARVCHPYTLRRSWRHSLRQEPDA